jgi:hypothetical protein
LIEETTTANFRVRFTLLATRDGGRDGYVNQGYRPNHRVVGETYKTFMGAFTFLGVQALYPGESCEATVRCLLLQRQLDQILRDKRWEVAEGHKLIGHVEIIEQLKG